MKLILDYFERSQRVLCVYVRPLSGMLLACCALSLDAMIKKLLTRLIIGVSLKLNVHP